MKQWLWTISLLFLQLVCAQAQPTVAADSQMLQQIQQLQQQAQHTEQAQQKLAQQVNTNENANQNAPQPADDTLAQSSVAETAAAPVPAAPSPSQAVSVAQPHKPQPAFEYPFAHAQISQSPIMDSVNDQAFNNAVTSVLPMSPQQIHRLKQLYTAAQYAAAAPAGIPPKPTATSIYVNLSPGSSPPAIRLSEGFVSSLVFLDSTGSPWPIAAYDLGNPTAFNIAWDKTDNILMIQAKTLYTYGNLAIRLKGLNTPVMLTLIPGQQIVDYRVDITVPGYGPDARSLPINTGLPPQATPILLNVLDGIPPSGSRQLEMSGNTGQAWLLRNKLYIRTRYTLLSPGWVATMSSADGTNAYELPQTPLLLISRYGKIEHIRIKGF